tara:strand:- start:1721 stop:3019 length:1299 start_codon:yes stop_codon:yes gene_type:complete
MSDLLWQKPGVQVDPRIQAFLAGDDVVLDREFIQDDITASAAHARGLARIGILTSSECDELCRELDALSEDLKSGAFVLDDRFEDCHSAIESRLIERLGDTGRKIHTGRSRNDQVLVATRLWLKRKLLELQALCRETAEVCLQRAEADSIPMPGYTHLQRAVVSSTAMWWAGFAEAFIDNAVRAKQAHDWIDANPLGTAAGYGVNLPLDREGSTKELGFARMQVSPIYAQLSRGKFEIAAVDALGAATLDLRRLAWDLSLFTTAEFGFVSLPAQYTTGSSIMPNKRNPDLVELLRATYASIAASRTELEQLLSLPSGYHRDLQFTKGALFHAFGRGLGAMALLPNLLRGMEWKPDRLAGAFDNGMYATDKAVELAVAGLPFREAYKQAAAEPLPKAGADPQASLDARTSPGGAASLGLAMLEQRLAALRPAE